ncbi:protein of unassigned function [Methylobacterium oryzae CBMB20]|uniref:Protein of unassigned function n=2 Tax=Methylobacterium oryzae TaxID=334852 RepID=A0A089Q9A4_9HYPH|nr:protein of unassigned function [Methylobacterium oryzae CBMB20]
MTLLDTLPESRRQLVLQKLSAGSKPVSSRRAGDVTGIVLSFIKHKAREAWSVGQVKDEILRHYADTNPKEIYNSINYLAKTGRIKRIGYGKYMIDGNLVVSSDPLGEDPFPNDDQADN